MPGFRWVSHGWKRALMLAKDGDESGRSKENAPDNNADTIALFASGKLKIVKA